MPVLRLLILLTLLAPLCRAEDTAASFKSKVAPILQSACTKCHGAEKQKAKINFASPRDLQQLTDDRDLWFHVLDKVESGEMPPEDETPLTPAQRQTILGWIRGDYTQSLLARQRQEGRSKLRRLSRSEYAYSMLDLFGIRPAVALNLPDDGRVDGYDKVSAALPLSASGAGGYFKMSEDLLGWVLRPIPKLKNASPANASAFDPGRTTHLEAKESGQSPGHSLRLEDNTIVSFNSDTTSGRLDYGARIPGLHRLRISVYGYQTDKPMPFGVYVGHTSAYPQILDLVKILEAPPGKAAVIETEIYLRTHDFNDRFQGNDGIRLIPFGIGVQVPKNSLAKNCKGPGLALQWVDVEEPPLPLAADRFLLADFPQALQEELRITHTYPLERRVVLQKNNPKNQAKSTTRDDFLAIMRATLKRVGTRLYRRDLTASELDTMLAEVARRSTGGPS